MTDRILRFREVVEITGLSRATIYRMMDRGDFPKALKLSTKAIGWRESVIQSWIETRISSALSKSKGKQL
ncbi:AlpA family transcriptional regulator [uncultured Roseovarius sp.]|uniref:helix-turn-helix transcriptional regulator n=1 Tax=uncultured Roseovarius sp. TaxID=293344 RepID=UPI0026155A25|nr:AlpA family transcriptional regulator [uncultured Roseovarius sp.]